jgi:glucosyl-3-phosphoglycerate synthase
MYQNDARMNGLETDRHKEEEAVELFAANIMVAGQTFLENPMETPFIPNWSRIQSANPDLLRHLFEAVKQDSESV